MTVTPLPPDTPDFDTVIAKVLVSKARRKVFVTTRVESGGGARFDGTLEGEVFDPLKDGDTVDLAKLLADANETLGPL